MNSGPQSKYLPDSQAIELVIFDCDGVLIDSELICAEILAHELQALGLPADCDYVLTHFLGQSYASMEDKIQQNLHATLPVDFKKHYHDLLHIAFEKKLQPTQNLVSVLPELKVDSCIATSSSPVRTERVLKLTGLSHFFGDNVYTASEVQNGKPAPDLFLHAAKKMNVDPSRCLVIEDSLAGLTAAASAGMNVWRYVGGSHLNADNHGLPQRLAQVPVFGSWDCFYEMAPNLKRTGISERRMDDD